MLQKASNKDTSTDSVRWYTIPTDTEMPKSDVTFRTIGFIGNVGDGATFKLYLDNEKTGAKTYHIYFKQLGGSGKLTLTTGVAGASNLTMNVGSYVTIVHVDEFGNVISSEFGIINSKIPANASTSNQLATQSDVNTAVSSDYRIYLTMVGGQNNYSSSQSTISFIPLWKGAKVGIAIGKIDFAVNGNNSIQCSLTIYEVRQIYDCFIQAFQYGNTDAYVAYNSFIEDFWIKSIYSTQNVQVKVLCYCEIY